MDEIEPQADGGFSRTSIFFACYVNLQTIIHYMLLRVEGMAMRMAVREELSL